MDQPNDEGWSYIKLGDRYVWDEIKECVHFDQCMQQWVELDWHKYFLFISHICWCGGDGGACVVAVVVIHIIYYVYLIKLDPDNIHCKWRGNL